MDGWRSNMSEEISVKDLIIASIKKFKKEEFDNLQNDLHDLVIEESTKIRREMRESVITIRDQFAMAALTGMLSDPNVNPENNKTMTEFREETARGCYLFADAMLKARDERR